MRAVIGPDVTVEFGDAMPDVGVGGIEAEAEIVAAAELEDLSENAAVHELFHPLVLRVAAHLPKHGEGGVVFFDGVDDAVGFFDGEGHRLLEGDGLARRGDGFDEISVEGGFGGDEEGVDGRVFDKIVQAFDGVELEVLRVLG